MDVDSLANFPWITGYDWNEILTDDENYGSNLCSIIQMNDYRHAINHIGLVDLRFSGELFTWTNKHINTVFIQERLDRFFSNALWNSSIERTEISNLDYYSSDHRPVRLHWSDNQVVDNSPPDIDTAITLRRNGSMIRIATTSSSTVGIAMLQSFQMTLAQT